MPEPGGPTFPSCTTQHSLPEPDCDNAADGVLTVVERSSGDLVLERLICQPCVEREIRGWMGGEPSPSMGHSIPIRVYPRVGGGTWSQCRGLAA